ncbi:MAG: S41 family peptidase [Pirellulaceae bacterium]
MPLRNIVIIAIAAVVSLACYSVGTRSRYAKLYSEAMHIVMHEGLMKTDERTLFDDSIDGMLSKFDRDTTYYHDGDFKSFEEDMQQRFDGIGMHIDLDEEAKMLVVLAPIPSGPASEAGLRPGDELVSIDDKPVDFTKRNEVVRMIRGPSGSSAKITVRRAGQELTFNVPRRPIDVPSVQGDWLNSNGKWSFVLRDHPRLGYLRITQFGDNTAAEFKSALEEIRDNIDGLLIDVRNNPGGLLPEVVKICDYFLPAGKLIVETRGREQIVKERHETTSDMQLPEGMPVVVLIDHHSASASEILAACLQDHQRAVVVGERSFGKGTVQNLILLENRRSALKLTTASYWRPSGKNIDRPSSLQNKSSEWGVLPNPGHKIPVNEIEIANLYRLRHLRDLAGIQEGFRFTPKPSYFFMKPILEVTNTAGHESHDSADTQEPQPDSGSDPKKMDFTDRALQHAIQLLKPNNAR